MGAGVGVGWGEVESNFGSFNLDRALKGIKAEPVPGKESVINLHVLVSLHAPNTEGKCPRLTAVRSTAPKTKRTMGTLDP